MVYLTFTVSFVNFVWMRDTLDSENARPFHATLEGLEHHTDQANGYQIKLINMFMNKNV